MTSPSAEDIQSHRIKIVYTNHRGETTVRNIVPIEIVFKTTEYHPEVQWLLRAYDLDRQDERHFACQNIRAWFA